MSYIKLSFKEIWEKGKYNEVSVEAYSENGGDVVVYFYDENGENLGYKSAGHVDPNSTMKTSVTFYIPSDYPYDYVKVVGILREKGKIVAKDEKWVRLGVGVEPTPTVYIYVDKTTIDPAKEPIKVHVVADKVYDSIYVDVKLDGKTVWSKIASGVSRVDPIIWVDKNMTGTHTLKVYVEINDKWSSSDTFNIEFKSSQVFQKPTFDVYLNKTTFRPSEPIIMKIVVNNPNSFSVTVDGTISIGDKSYPIGQRTVGALSKLEIPYIINAPSQPGTYTLSVSMKAYY